MENLKILMDPQLDNTGSLAWTLIIGLAIALLYNIIKKVVLPAIKEGRFKEHLEARLVFTEGLFWPAFLLVLSIRFMLNRPLAGAIVLLLVSAVFWHPIRNYFLGLLLQIGDTYKLGQRIVFRGSKGVIKAFNPLGMEIELDGGGSLDVPYTNFNSELVIRTSPTSGVLSHSIELIVNKPCDLELEKQNIKSMLLSMPYVLPDQKIVFEHLREDEYSIGLKVIAHGLDQEQMYRVESRLKQEYRDNKLRKVN